MPAPVYPTGRDYYAYISDDSNTYTIATTDSNAGSQTSPPSPISPKTHPAYPRGWKVRHVQGTVVVSGIVYRTRLPIFDPSDPIWLGSSSTFAKGGATFVSEGAIGERRTYKGG